LPLLLRAKKNTENETANEIKNIDKSKLTVNKLVRMTTAGNFEDCTIIKHIGVVSARTVVGTSFFTEIFAGFTDVFGGRSKKIENELLSLEESAVFELEQKTMKLGGNAIIGYRFDIDEISGKNMQMFMISVSGTATVIKESIEPETGSIM
jgi:uncharacterized protein YbjQ (UPF0145 family)